MAERLLAMQSEVDECSGLVTDLIHKFKETDLQRQFKWAEDRGSVPVPRDSTARPPEE
jgi:hypothetical protein